MRTHISLPTGKLAESVSFYRVLLGKDPVKDYPAYALFLTDDPGLELALNAGGNAKVDSRSHFGLAVESTSQVDQAIARLKAAQLAVEIERGETCCYAKQDKVWATDPDGRRWEVYHVIEETARRDSESSTCCGNASSDDSESCCASSS